MEQPTSYYSLGELLVQRQNCLKFGMSPLGIEVEIALVVERQTAEARRRHPSSRYFDRPFDQDIA